MLTDLFRSPLQHADPAKRLAAIAKLAPDSEELATMLTGDPAPEVRAAAAGRVTNIDALAAALTTEGDSAVRDALTAALATLLGEMPDAARAAAFLGSPQCTDAMRAEVARRGGDPDRRRAAIAAIRDEAPLVDLAVNAEHAQTRMAAAERVATADGLRAIADAARDKDRGVSRFARQRLDAMTNREATAAQADAILAELEALAQRPGPIVTPLVELNRRWEALDLGNDAERLARVEAARQALQARFEREHAEQRARADFERRLDQWLGRTEPPGTLEELDTRRAELAALREDAPQFGDAALSRLAQAEERAAEWGRSLEALGAAEALVVEAEQLAASTAIDDANLPQRWDALDAAIRTPALKQRFDAALDTVTQRRAAHVRAAEQEAQAARHHLHALLHTAETALAAGQLHEARGAAEEIRVARPSAGQLPKPTLQRLGRLLHQLKELEGWESFGQHQVRVQLCERAEAVPKLTLSPPQIAAEVQKLRNEWTALDAQHGAPPRTLRDRFDRACERAYAPAARFFAEQAAKQKEARKQREEFIAAAAAHAPTLLTEPHDWRAIERWLRETDRRWREGDLGSVDPKLWKTLDARLKTALQPLRDALSGARDEAKARRSSLIEEAKALAGKALERDTPGEVKALQAKWQAEAKQFTLPKRDEQALWEEFRAACDAVFQAREAKRKEADGRKREARGALENICIALEQLAHGTDKEEQQLRREAADLQEQWRRAARSPDAGVRALEGRFGKAKTAVEAAIAARARARKNAVWHTLAAKERLCEELDGRASSRDHADVDAASLQARWDAAGALPGAWEKAMAGRRDAALRALADDSAATAHVAQIERGADTRQEMLLELELALGLDSPPELQGQRRALQLRQLRDRFKGGAAPGDPGNAAERLVAWCAHAGVADGRDRARIGRVFAAIERVR